jgi:hypothetical protein
MVSWAQTVTAGSHDPAAAAIAAAATNPTDTPGSAGGALILVLRIGALFAATAAQARHINPPLTDLHAYPCTHTHTCTRA